jgi:hypothetical protein
LLALRHHSRTPNFDHHHRSLGDRVPLQFAVTLL